MRAFSWLLTLLFLVGCKESTQPQNAPQKPSEASTEAPVAQLKGEHVAADFANLLGPLIDPAKLDTLKGKRAADQFFSQHPIIYRPTHPKNRTPTGGVSPLPTTPFSEIRRSPVQQKGADMTQMDPKIAPIRSHFGG